MSIQAHHAIDTILDRNDRLETILHVICRAWTNIEHGDRVDIGHQWPRLADALILAEQARREE